jgi:glutamate--cysteine ligase
MTGLISGCQRMKTDEQASVHRIDGRSTKLCASSTDSDQHQSKHGPLELSDLVRWFFPDADRRRLVGLEIEYGLVRPETGESVGYEEAFGVEALLKELLNVLGGDPIMEGRSLVGLTLLDKSTLTLEMGGAIEYSSYPQASLTDSLLLAKRRLTEVARVAEHLQIRILTGGLLPFDSPEKIRWAPKPRTAIMRRHFRRLGDKGLFGDSVMGLTLSTQVSLDALTPAEYLDKLKALIAVSPFIAALLLNAPSLRGSGCEGSLRMLYWRRIDPARCQDLTDRVLAVGSIEELATVLISLPMIYRRREHTFLPGPRYPFRDILKRGFQDGSLPRISDWECHLAQLWPAVRPRRTLETRLPDGQAWRHLESLPALFIGLVEEPYIRQRALDLVGGLPPDVLDSIAIEAASNGLCGLPAPVQEMGLELIDLAREGLASRVARGIEAQTLLQSVEPIREVAITGQTFAGRLLEMWNGKWNKSPQRYVEAMSVPLYDELE